MKFYKCPVCGQIVEKIKDKNIPIMCCGKVMEEVPANTVEASTEKHIPIINMEKNVASIEVGSIAHPMEEAHYIEFIYVVTNKGNYRYNLKPNDEAKITLVLSDNEKIMSAYAYCNLHGLWKAE